MVAKLTYYLKNKKHRLFLWDRGTYKADHKIQKELQYHPYVAYWKKKISKMLEKEN